VDLKTVLAGDIGGTHARLGLFDVEADSRAARIQETLRCSHFPGLAELVQHFVQKHSPSLAGACLAVAGPVADGRGVITNLGWPFDAAAFAARLGLQRLHILNDLEAVGYGLKTLPATGLKSLSPGAPAARGNLAIIAAGTGLGQCACYFDGTDHHPVASQGGHADFAPRTDIEIELLRHLRGKFPHVSYERVVSGPGLQEIYKFMQATGRGGEPADLTAAILKDGKPEAVVNAAVSGKSERCVLAAQMLLGILAAEAGNLALKVMARGGVYVGGGMARRLLPLLSAADFMQVFTSKGAMRELLAAMPVHIILDDDVGLLGAARYAMKICHSVTPAKAGVQDESLR
jgi:glucokinase